MRQLVEAHALDDIEAGDLINYGSAPDIYSRAIANPIGQIWSGAIMLEHLGEPAAGAAIVRAIESVLEPGSDAPRTPDIGGPGHRGGRVAPGAYRTRRSVVGAFGLLAVCLLMRLRPTLVEPVLNRALSTQLDVLSVTWLLGLVASSDIRAVSDFVREPLRRLASAPELRIRTLARRTLRSIGEAIGPFPASAPEAGLLDVHPDRSVAAHVWTRREDERDDIDEGCMASTEAGDTCGRAEAESLVTEVAGARLYRAQGALPGLGPVLVSRVAKDLAAGRFRRRMRAQLDHLSSRATPEWPDAILVSDELAEQALQEIAGRGRAAHAAAGRLITDSDGWESSLATALDGGHCQALREGL